MYGRHFKPVLIGLLVSLTLFLLTCGLRANRVLADTQSQVSPLGDSKNIQARGPHEGLASPKSDLASKRVLILHSFAYAQPAYRIIDAALIKSFAAGGLDFNNLYFEFLDLARNPGREYRKRVLEHFREQFKARKIDLILTLHPEALEFLLNDARHFVSDVPIISVLGENEFKPPDLKRAVILLPFSFDVISTTGSILKLQPDTRKILVAAGSSALDRRFAGLIKARLQAWKGEAEVTVIPALPMDEILKTVATLPPGTAILYATVYADSTGKTFIPADAARMISAAASVPVYGLFETLLGDNGVVGGTILSHEVEGERAVRLALEILHGKLPAQPFTVLPAPLVPMFDWQQLKRWGLNETALPAGAIVLNKPVSVWERYRWAIIGIIVFCLAETALIIFLVVQRRRKKMAEESLRNAEEKYRDIFNSALEGIFETSPQGQSLTANPAMAKMLGYDSPEEVMSTIRDSGQQVWVDPNERLQYVRLLEEQGVIRGYECQYKRKDGTKFWVSLNTRRVSGPDGQTLFYTGFMEDITERKRAEEAIRESEAKYRSLYESMMDGFVVVGMDGLISEYNESFRKITGYAPEELLKLTYRDLTPGKWHDVEQKIIEEQILARGYSDVYEKEYRKKDGTVFPVELRTFLLRDEQGNNSGMWAIVRDITERKRAEGELRKSEERLRLVLEANSEGVWDWNIPSGHAVFSPRYSAMLGYEPDEFAKSYVSWKELVHPDDFERVNAAHAEHINEGKEFCVELRMRKKSGDWCWILSRGTVVERDAEGRAIRMVGTHLDITERKRAEAALHESRERFRQVAENVGDFIWEIDAQGLYLYTSPSVKKILGYSPDELVGKMHFYDLFTSDVREELKTAAFKTFATKQSFRAFPNPNISKDGRVVYLETSGSPVLDASGNLVGYRGVDADITEQQTLEARLRQAEKMEALGTLTGGIAHDFNNILAAMIGFAELVKEKLPKGSRDERHLQMVMDAGLRGRGLIKQMLAFSRQTEQEKKPLQLSAIVQETGRFLRASIPATISIRVNVESESGPVLADPVQIQQVVMNLCTNAAHAMREKGGVLDLHLCDFSVARSEAKSDDMKPGLYIKLAVRDTGIGIQPEMITRIFDPFFTTKKPDEGTGLGLSVVQGIVQQHDGYITVESQPGKGSAFTVYLPKVAEQPGREGISDEAAPTGHERILLVDDEKALTETGQEFLEGLGYEVTVRNSSVEALALFTDNPRGFDLIVTDQTMPDMTGLELAKACVALRPDIPIVLTTGFSHLVNQTAANEAGIRAMVMKPLTRAELARTVRKALDG